MITEDRLLLPTSISLSCGICNQVCKRASKLLCCDAQCCWGCGVRYITKNRQCWACPNVTAETGDLVHHPQLREIIRKQSQHSDTTNTPAKGSSGHKEDQVSGCKPNGQSGPISTVDEGQIVKVSDSLNRQVKCSIKSPIKERILNETHSNQAQDEASPFKQPMFGLFGCELENDASQVTDQEPETTSNKVSVDTVVRRRVSSELTREDIDHLEDQLDEDCWSPPKDIKVAFKVKDSKIETHTIQSKVQESSQEGGQDKSEKAPRSSPVKHSPDREVCVTPSDTSNREVSSPKPSPRLSMPATQDAGQIQMTEKEQENQTPSVGSNTLPTADSGQNVDTLVNKVERTSLRSGSVKNEPVKISLKDRFASLSKKIIVSNSTDASAELETFHKNIKEKNPEMDGAVNVNSSDVSVSRKVKLVDDCSPENILQEEKERIAKILETKNTEKSKSESPDKSLKSVPITNALQFLQVGLKLSKIAKTTSPTEIPFLEEEKEPEKKSETAFGFKRSRSRHANKLKLGVIHAESPPTPKEDVSSSSTPKRSTRSSSKSSPTDSRPNISKDDRRDESGYKSRHSDPCSRSRPSDSSHRLRRRSSSRTKKPESSRFPRDERKERSSSRDRKRRSRSGDNDKRHSRTKNDKRNRSRSREKRIKIEEAKSSKHDIKDEPRERSNSVGEKRKINRKSVIQGSIVSRYLDELAHKSSEEHLKEENSEPNEPVAVNISNPLPKFQSFQMKDIRNRLGGTDPEPDPEAELRVRISNRAAEKIKRQKDKVDRETEVKVISYSANLSMPVGVNIESGKELAENSSKEENVISSHSLPKFQSFKLRDRLNERVFSDDDSDTVKVEKPKTESEYRSRIANRTAEKLKRQREKAELDEEIQVISYSANLSMPKTREAGKVETLETKARNWRKNPAKREDLQAELKRVNSQVQTIKLTNELERVNSKLTSELERAKVRVSEVEDSKEHIKAVSEEPARCTSVDLKKEMEDLEGNEAEISNLSISTNVESFHPEKRTIDILGESDKVEDNVDKPKGITEEEVEEGEIVESKRGKRKKKKKHKKNKRRDESVSKKVARRKSLDLIKEELESVTIKVEDIRRAESKTVEEFFAEKRTVKIVPSSADTSICTETETSYDDDIVNLAKDVHQLEQEVEDIKLNGGSQTRKRSKKKLKDGKKKSKTKIDDNIEIDPKIAQKIISRIISNDLGKISEDFRNAVKEEVSNTENEIKSIKQVLKKKTHKSEKPSKADKAKKKKKSKSKEKEEKRKIKEEKGEIDIKIEKEDEENVDSLDRNITLLKEQLQSLKEPSKSTEIKSNLASCESSDNISSNEEKVKRKKRKRSKSKDGKEGRKKKKSKRKREEEDEQSTSVAEHNVEEEPSPPLVPPDIVGRKNFGDDMPVLEDEVILPVETVEQTESSAPPAGELPVAQSENFDLVIGIEDSDVLESNVDAGQETEELYKDSETRDQLLDDRVKVLDDLNAVSTTVDSEAGDSNPVSEEENPMNEMSEESMRAMLLSQVASAWASAPVTTTTKSGEAPKLLRSKKRPANPSPTPTTRVVTPVPSPPSTLISSSTVLTEQPKKIIRLKPKEKPKVVAESEVTSTTNYPNMALPRYEYCYSRTFISREEKMEFFPNLYQRFIVPLDCSSSEDEEDAGDQARLGQSTYTQASLNQLMRKSRKSASPL